MDKALWRSLSPLLDKALDLEPAAREHLLVSLWAESPALAEALRELLADQERLLASPFLETAPDLGQRQAALTGYSIGAYTFERPLGAGGMGAVWLARRSDGRFEGAAAVKLVNLAILDRMGEERFRREGSLLARLSHPNIARLLDAGVTAAGQPYLVLEYVEGLRIDRYAAEHSLSIGSRLDLFLQVADAVAHAHVNLVVHRDLKPSNILVDSDGRVKLLDFGIATLIDGDGRQPALTVTGRAFTPEYAAPEQATGGPITTATDVYPLGVLLYQLLVGLHPTAAEGASDAVILRNLVELDAPRLSDTAAHLRSEDPNRRRLLDERATTRERLVRTCRGDLDTILAVALKRDPAHRYGSVSALAEDLRRYRRLEPISARPDTLTYRAGKFIRRHRWPVAAAIAASMALAAGLLLANQQRLTAESRFRQLRHLSEQVFGLDSRISNLAGATDARQALVAVSVEYLEGLARDARGDLDLMQEVSDGYWRVARIQGVPTGLNLGDAARAEESLKKAGDLADSILASQPRNARALERSATIAQDRMILADSERRDADAMVQAQTAVDRAERLLALGSPTETQLISALSVYGNVATAFVNMNRYDEGVRYATRKLELARANGALNAVSYALTVLANARRLQGDLEGALKAIREAREVAERTTYPNETKRMFDRYPLLLREAFILGEDRGVSLERPAEAIIPLREAFEMHESGARRDANDSVSRTRVATTGRKLGDILRWRDPEEALAVYDVALRRLDEIKNNVKARRDKALVLASSSYALRHLKRTADARRRLDEAVAILTETHDYPSDRISLDGELSSVLQALADQSADEGRVTAAVAQYEQLLEKILAARPAVEDDLRAANRLSLLYSDLARLHRLSGAADKADRLEANRLALWQRWSRRLPGNAFVARRLGSNQP